MMGILEPRAIHETFEFRYGSKETTATIAGLQCLLENVQIGPLPQLNHQAMGASPHRHRDTAPYQQLKEASWLRLT